MASPSQGPPTALSFPPERAEGVARPHLLILSGPELGTAVELGNVPLEIGRDSDCAVTLTSDGVSRKHARVQLIFALYFVTDLGSTNGTFVNDQRVSMAQLNDGDQLRIGDAALKFVTNHLEVQYTKRALDLATTDALTGALNKQQFDAGFDKALHLAQKSRHKLSLILFDIDHFKLINDKFGHAAGDLVLASAARIISAALPANASLYRVGGEEFAIVLQNADRADGFAQAERIRILIAQERIEHHGRRVPLTISLGVAEAGAAEASSELYQRADALLYASKDAGRNRVS
jgi:two-component system, cell cycle response regulator